MKIRKIDHVHLIVKNLDESLKSFEKILGLNPWPPIGINDLGFALQTMLTPRDGARIELLQPKSQNDRFSKLLKERGEGVYGISVFIDDFDAEIKKLKEKGVAVEEETMASLFPDHPFRLAWVPPSEGQGVWLELVDTEVLPDFEKAWESVD
jgi:catechol 2,3-dioxygenase-like lactoylglutathione lyase family enzyme